MEMHQVRYFLAVCETLNFTRAAEHCHVAQPSLTRAVKKLEAELGGPLFRRERHRTHLTDLGRLMKPHLERLFDAGEAARAEASDYRQLDKAPLRLGVMCTLGPNRLAPMLQAFMDEVPGAELSLREARGGQVVEDLLAGDLDVALLGLPDYPDRLDCAPLYGERYVVAFARGHRFEGMNAVPLAAIDGEDYLARINCEYPQHLQSIGRGGVIAPNVRYSSEREDWIQAMIMTGWGCSIMPEYLPTLPGIATRVIVEPEISRTIHLASVAGRSFSPATAAFMRVARRRAWERSAQRTP